MTKNWPLPGPLDIQAGGSVSIWLSVTRITAGGDLGTMDKLPQSGVKPVKWADD